MFGLLFMLGSMALTAYGSSQQRKEMRRQEDEYERKINEEMAFKTDLSADQSNFLLRKSRYERGTIKAVQAASGTAVGEGSNVAQLDQPAANYRRKVEALQKTLGFEKVSSFGDIKEFGHRTDSAIESSYWAQGATMLRQGYGFGKEAGWWGVEVSEVETTDAPFIESGLSGFDQSGGMSGMSGQGYWGGGL